MKIITEKISIQSLPLFQQHTIKENMLFFDIETTGLSPAKDQIYCIGCGFREKDDLIAELFFADSSEEEGAVIDGFIRRLCGFHTMITFNGSTFDIPFLRKKTAHLQQDIFQNTAHIDLYREARSMRQFLQLRSYKQKNIEQFLGCFRADQYNGGQLTDLYKRYVIQPDNQTRELLLLHNCEDVKGMFEIYGILAYKELLNGNFEMDAIQIESEHNSNTLNIRIIPGDPLPQNITHLEEYVSIYVKNREVLLCFPIQRGELKTFFPDPENYYYLPDEDCAVHKSVGIYVDPDHRQKANRKNCYTRSFCDYITVPSNGEKSKLRQTYEDKHIYLDLNHMSDKTLKDFILLALQSICK